MNASPQVTKSEAITAMAALLPIVADQSSPAVATDCEKLFKLIKGLQDAAQELCPVLHDPCQPVEINPSDSGIDL